MNTNSSSADILVLFLTVYLFFLSFCFKLFIHMLWNTLLDKCACATFFKITHALIWCYLTQWLFSFHKPVKCSTISSQDFIGHVSADCLTNLKLFLVYVQYTVLCKSLRPLVFSPAKKKGFKSVISIFCCNVSVGIISLHFQTLILPLIVIIQWDFCLTAAIHTETRARIHETS